MKIRIVALAAVLGVPLLLGSVWAEESQPGQAQEDQLLSRIDFGNSYVMGQSIKSGAVYLLNRKKSDIQSMLDSRKDYRQEIREDAEVADTTRERFSRQ